MSEQGWLERRQEIAEEELRKLDPWLLSEAVQALLQASDGTIRASLPPSETGTSGSGGNLPSSARSDGQPD